jgi:hypothetical protein
MPLARELPVPLVSLNLGHAAAGASNVHAQRRRTTGGLVGQRSEDRSEGHEWIDSQYWWMRKQSSQSHPE